MRLTDEQIATLRVEAKDLRLHAKHVDALALADRGSGDTAGERMWKLEAKQLRRRAKRIDEDVSDEFLDRRIDRIRQRLLGTSHTSVRPAP